MSDSVGPHRQQPTRLPHPWDSPGKNTGVGRHFLLQCMKVKSESEVAQLHPTLSDPRDCSPPGSSVHGIFQARVLEWCAIAFSEMRHKGTIKVHYQQLNELNCSFMPHGCCRHWCVQMIICHENLIDPHICDCHSSPRSPLFIRASSCFVFHEEIQF